MYIGRTYKEHRPFEMQDRCTYGMLDELPGGARHHMKDVGRIERGFARLLVQNRGPSTVSVVRFVRGRPFVSLNGRKMGGNEVGG